MKFASNVYIAAALGLATVPRALGYESIDVCRVDVSLIYSSPSNNTYMFAIGDQDTTGQIDLAAGVFKIKIEGKLCGDLTDNAYEGESAEITMEAGGAEQSIQIIALDLETAGNQDLDKNIRPIITSFVVSPSVVRADDVPTMTFAAVDPNGVGDISSWEITAISSGTAWQGSAPALVSGCAADDGSCVYSYKADAADAGQMQFSMVVTDDESLSDSVSGYLAVDTTGRVTFDVKNYNRPMISNFQAVTSQVLVAGEAPNTRVPYASKDSVPGSVGTLTFDVTDTDLPQHPGHSVTISLVVTELIPGANLTTGDQISPGCNDADFSITKDTFGPGDADADGNFSVEVVWAPWSNAQNSVNKTASDFGEAWCQVSIVATDNSPDSTLRSGALVSDTYTYTMGAIGTEQERSTSKIPQFSMIFVEDYSPAVNDAIKLVVSFDDADDNDNTELKVDASDLDSTYGDGSGVSVADYSCDTLSSCDGVEIVIPAVSAVPGSHTLTLTLTDKFNTDLKDVRVIAFNVQASSSRRRRSDGERRSDTWITDLTINNGRLVVGVEPFGPSLDESNANDAVTSGNAGAVVGIAVGAVVIVALVAIVVVKKIRSAPAPASQELSWDNSNGFGRSVEV